MIAASAALDQQALALMREHDPVVQRYRAFFALLDWSQIPERDETRQWPGSPPHPEVAYVKALLIKLCEHKAYISHLRSFLVDHPLLVMDLGFRLVPDPTQLYRFDV